MIGESQKLVCMISDLFLKCAESLVFLLPVLPMRRFDKLCHGSLSEGEVRALFLASKNGNVFIDTHRRLVMSTKQT